MTRHERFNLFRCRCGGLIAFSINQSDGIDTVTLKFIDPIFVDNGLLESGFKLPAALLSLLCISNGVGLLKANLEMTHEGLNRWFFAHDTNTRPVPHESLPSASNGRLMIRHPLV